MFVKFTARNSCTAWREDLIFIYEGDCKISHIIGKTSLVEELNTQSPIFNHNTDNCT